MIFTVTPNPVLDRTLTVPEIVFDDVVRALEVREDWGGKGFNVSRALAAMGIESEALGFIGGVVGDKLSAGLRGLGIAHNLTPIAGETRTNLVIVEAESRRYVKVNEAGPEVSAVEATMFFEDVRAKVRAGDWWALCGSLPPGVPVDFYAHLIDLIQGQGARVALDTGGEPLRVGLTAHPYLVKPNEFEAAALTGAPVRSESDAQAAAEAFLAQGACCVALSMGAEGLLWATREEQVRARPPHVRAKHPTGAGDALLAGILRASVAGLPPVEIARWGVAAGTAAALQEGIGVGSLEDVIALHVQVTANRKSSPNRRFATGCSG